jgi:hypothetical protein
VESTPALPLTAPTELLTVDQLAERLQMPRASVLNLTRTRQRQKNPIPVIHVTPQVLRFDWHQVQLWLQTKTDIQTGRKPRAYHRQRRKKAA